MFYIDKYRPNSYEAFSYNNDLVQLLKGMNNNSEMPHMIFYGSSGVGKKTLINIFLQNIFGPQVNNIQEIPIQVKKSGGTTIPVLIKKSLHHIIYESTGTGHDKHVIQEIIKTFMAPSAIKFKLNFKVILIYNSHDLQSFTQSALRRTMEKYSSVCRFIMVTNSLLKIQEPIRSRCVCARVEAPSNDEMFKILLNISTKEEICFRSHVLSNVVKKANGDIRKALWLLTYTQLGIDDNNQYEQFIEKIIDLLLDKSCFVIQQLKVLVYNVLRTNIQLSQIINDIIKELCKKNIPEEKKLVIFTLAAIYDNNNSYGRRPALHLEPFLYNIVKQLHT